MTLLRELKIAMEADADPKPAPTPHQVQIASRIVTGVIIFCAIIGMMALYWLGTIALNWAK